MHLLCRLDWKIFQNSINWNPCLQPKTEKTGRKEICYQFIQKKDCFLQKHTLKTRAIHWRKGKATDVACVVKYSNSSYLRWRGLDRDRLGSPSGWGGLWLHLLLGRVIVSHSSIYLWWSLGPHKPEEKDKNKFIQPTTNRRHYLAIKTKSIGEFLLFNL
jgi:hypothetical protein